MCWCCWRKIIKISPCLSKLELAKVGAFSETQCSEKWASPVEFSWHGDVCCQYILRYIYNSRVLTVICICFSSIHFKSMFVVYCHCYKKLRTYHCGVMTCSVDAEWSDDFDRQTCVCVCVCVCVRCQETHDPYTQKSHKPMTLCEPMTSWVWSSWKIAFLRHRLPIDRKSAQCHEYGMCREFHPGQRTVCIGTFQIELLKTFVSPSHTRRAGDSGISLLVMISWVCVVVI